MAEPQGRPGCRPFEVVEGPSLAVISSAHRYRRKVRSLLTSWWSRIGRADSGGLQYDLFWCDRGKPVPPANLLRSPEADFRSMDPRGARDLRLLARGNAWPRRAEDGYGIVRALADRQHQGPPLLRQRQQWLRFRFHQLV